MGPVELMVLVWRMGDDAWRCIEHDVEQCPECVTITLPPTDSPTPGVETRGRPVSSRAAAPSRSRNLSVVGDRSSGALACPRCRGTQFKVRRRTSTKVLFGVASLLGQAKHVRCVTCGSEYDRG
jgi:hypothetical protein